MGAIIDVHTYAHTGKTFSIGAGLPVNRHIYYTILHPSPLTGFPITVCRDISFPKQILFPLG